MIAKAFEAGLNYFKSRETRFYKTYIVSMSLFITIAVVLVFTLMALRTRQFIYEEMYTRARAHFNSIVAMRQWIANYGGVYVEKRHGVISNPYLVNPDITSTGGKVYTKRNPALMTRELAELIEKSDVYKLHITSLRLFNPSNRPDAFERKGLEGFEEGKMEYAGMDIMDDKPFYRYMGPLYVTEACLQCHSEGYKIGDVRGAITISVNVEPLEDRLRRNLAYIAGMGVFMLALGLGLFYYFTFGLLTKIRRAREVIEEIAITDELTGIYNRRYLVQRLDAEFKRSRRGNSPLSVILLDIDHFKLVNDRYGHLAGDAILREITNKIRGNVREYDILGRLGGEEFLVVSPDTGKQEALAVAERIRMEIKHKCMVKFEGKEIGVTASLGIASLDDADENVDGLLRKVDKAMYEAKGTGRDRSVCV